MSRSLLRFFSDGVERARSRSRSHGRSPSPAEWTHADAFDEPRRRLGLQSLWPQGTIEQAKATIDIVAVHGLGGDPFETWQATDTHHIWLRDFLPDHFADAHIMSFGYHSRLLSKSISRIHDYARDLLAQLEATRTVLNTEHNPIIFICHSLGGIVVKKALVLAHERQDLYQDLSPMVKAIMFFGTPHRGSELANWSTISHNLANCTTVGQLRTDVLEDLEFASNILRDISSQFLERSKGLQIVSFYETEKIRGVIVVHPDSAELYSHNERPIPISANHITMCKFSDASSPEYVTVLGNLMRLAKYSRVTREQEHTGPGASAKDDAASNTTGPPYGVDQQHFSNNYTAGGRQHYGNSYNISYYYAGNGKATSQTFAQEPELVGNKHWHVTSSRCEPFLHFTGQESILDALEDALLPIAANKSPTGRKFVLKGLPGAGKTQIALRFASQNRQSFWGVFWADITSKRHAHISFAKLARGFGSLVGAGEHAMVEFTTMLANASKPWLLILNNPEVPNYNYSSYFPASPHGSVLILARSDVDIHLDTIERQQTLLGLEQTSAVKLLIRLSGNTLNNDDTTRACAIVVGYLQAFPLAIVIAGSLIASGLCTANEYPRTLKKKESEMKQTEMAKTRPFYATYFAAFETSMHYLSASTHPAAKHATQLHRILTFLDRRSVSEEIFVRAWRSVEDYVVDRPDQYHGADDGLAHMHFLGPWHVQKVRSMTIEWASSTDLEAFHAACALLSDLSLITWDREARTISMHGALHYWSLQRLDEGENAQAWAAAASILAHSISNDDYWQQFYHEEPDHLGTCVRSSPANVESFFPPVNAAGVTRICFRFHWQLLRSEDVRRLYDPLWKRIVRIAGPALDLEGPLGDGNSIALYHLRAVALERLGRHDEAIQLGLEVLRARRKNFPSKHVAILWSKHSLASSYLSSGQAVEAVRLLENVMRSPRLADVIKIDHEDTPFLSQSSPSIDNPQDLINCLQKDATGIVETSISPSVATMWIPYDLGRAYISAGQHARGLQLLEKCLLGADALFPAGHYYRVRRTLALAAFCIAAGYMEKAIEILLDLETLPPATRELNSVVRKATAHVLFLNYRFEATLSPLKTVLDSGYALSEETITTLNCELYHCYIRTGRQSEADQLEGLAKHSDFDAVLRSARRELKALFGFLMV